MIPCGLLLGAAAVRVLALWLMCGEKETSKGLAFSTTSMCVISWSLVNNLNWRVLSTFVCLIIN